MRIVFMGTPEFAVPSLTALHEAGHEIVGVFTQPDKPVGRKQVLTPPPVKVEAQRLNLKVFQPETFKNRACEPLLQELAPELITVVAYGKILPRHVLELPKYGCVNLHGSLLPKYRGAAPIQWSVINGDEETGVTTMFLAPGIDTGDMILSVSTSIGQYETYGELHDRLAALGAPLLVETLRLLEEGTAPRTPHDEAKSSYAPMLDKTVARLDFSQPAAKLSKLICGVNPWPVANTLYQGKLLKVFSAVLGETTEREPGFAIGGPQGIEVACGDHLTLIFTEVQLEGSKRMKATDFLVGRPMKEELLLGTEQ
jgi:methionyl-tRNA formyltransferase